MMKYKDERRPIRLKFYLLAFCLFLIIVLSSNASAYQKKMTLKQCEYSFNDDTFGEWDEEEQKGVFMRVENKNLQLGEGENPVYNHISYQEPRQYYNNFETTNEDSTIPMLQVREGQENKIYADCDYKVGDYRIFIHRYILLYRTSRLTHDFNLTEGIVTENLEDSGKYRYREDGWSTFNGTESPLSWGQKIQLRRSSLSEVDNGFSQGGPSILYNEGLFPNTEPNIKSKLNISDFASGIYFTGTHHFEENSKVDLFLPKMRSIFYINSSLRNTEDMLTPSFMGFNAINENTGDTLEDDGRFPISSGDKITAEYTFRNNFNMDLKNVRITHSIYSELGNSPGIGTVDTDLYGCSLERDFPGCRNSRNFRYMENAFRNFSAGEQKTISISRTIPENSIFPKLRGEWRVFSEHPDSYGGHSWPEIGGDDIAYMGFRGFDPRIEFSIEEWRPIFNMDLDLDLAKNFAANPKIRAGDYDLLFEVYHDKMIEENKVKNFTIPLDEEAFDEMSVNKLEAGDERKYNVDIPLEEEYKEGVYHVIIYSIKRTEPFKDKKIGTLRKVPYFEAGQILYAINDRIDFVEDVTENNEVELTVFNPTFENKWLSLDLTDISDSENYTLETEEKDIHLGPAESKDIKIGINATYDDWEEIPEEGIEEDLEFTANISGVREDSVTIDLNASSLDRYIDLVANNLEVSNEEVYINETFSAQGYMTLDSTEESFDENSGNKISASIVIKNQDEGEIVDSYSKDFVIGEGDFQTYESSIGKTLAEDFSINKEGEYTILFEVGSSDIDLNDGIKTRYDSIIVEEKPVPEDCENVNLDDESYDSCLDESYCSWNYSNGEETSPPGNIGYGSCIFCDYLKAEESYTSCSIYNNEESCEKDNCDIAYESVELLNEDIECGNTTDEGNFVKCNCVWDDDNQCKGSHNFESPDPGDDYENYECRTSVDSESECKEGVMEVGINKEIIEYDEDGDIINRQLGIDEVPPELRGELSDCKDKTKEIPCLKGGLLNFFNISSLIITILLVAFYYSLLLFNE